MKNAIILYWTNTGNTEKVARAIEAGLISGGMQTSLVKYEDAGSIDFFDFDLVCIGAPSYSWHPPKPVDDFLKERFQSYWNSGKVKLGSPRVPGKNALIFCTYSGNYTGIAEAIPTGLYMSQFFDHLGIEVVEEIYVLSEFRGSLENSTLGRMGDIRGLPTDDELNAISEKARKVAKDIIG